MVKNTSIKAKYRTAVRRLFQNQSPSKKAIPYIGCLPDELRGLIKARLLPGMSMENFGKTWVIDHLVPLEIFDLNNSEELALCLNYENLFPMFKKDNQLKGASVHFSKEILQSMPSTKVRQQLIEKCDAEISDRYSKYLSSSFNR